MTPSLQQACPTLAQIIAPWCPSGVPAGLSRWLDGEEGRDWTPLIGELVAERWDDRPPVSYLELQRIFDEEREVRATAARSALAHIEAAALRLVNAVGFPAVQRAYGERLARSPVRDIPGIFAELGVCAWLSTRGSLKRLSPPTGRRRKNSSAETEADAVVSIGGHDVWVEVKRFEDSWESRRDPKKPARSLLTRDDVKPGTFRPYTMDLTSKLADTPDQLPLNVASIVFVILIHRLPSDLPWLSYALLGEPHKALLRDDLREGALFAQPGWESVSACCRTIVVGSEEVLTPQVHYNPRASVSLPPDVRSVLEETASRVAMAAAL